MGAIAADNEIFHVGVYAYINPPKFRTVGFVSSGDIVPVLPLDREPLLSQSDFLARFGTSGRIDIEGVIYSYAAKNIVVNGTSDPIMGPFQLRNMESWDSPFNSDRNGKSYQGGKAVEITQFAWLNGTTNWDDWAGAIVASSSGYSWLLDQTQWKVWITTGGEVVWLRNRVRHYSDTIPDYYPDGNERVFITNGLENVTVEGEVIEYRHEYGAWVYIHNDDAVVMRGFSGYNGLHDQSVRNLLKKFCQIAGTNATFPGDEITVSREFDDEEEYEL
jgi:hypothetical protein